MASKLSAERLQTKHGAILTMQRDEARRALPRLREFLDCDAVSIEVAIQDTDWMAFVLHCKWHEVARAFLAGWQRGNTDGLDCHYQRRSYLEEIAAVRETGEVPLAPLSDRAIHALAIACLPTGLGPWDAPPASLSQLKKGGLVARGTDGQYRATDAGRKRNGLA
jgi:hypothetical protein